MLWFTFCTDWGKKKPRQQELMRSKSLQLHKQHLPVRCPVFPWPRSPPGTTERDAKLIHWAKLGRTAYQKDSLVNHLPIGVADLSSVSSSFTEKILSSRVKNSIDVHWYSCNNSPIKCCYIDILALASMQSAALSYLSGMWKVDQSVSQRSSCVLRLKRLSRWTRRNVSGSPDISSTLQLHSMIGSSSAGLLPQELL